MKSWKFQISILYPLDEAVVKNLVKYGNKQTKGSSIIGKTNSQLYMIRALRTI